MTEPKIPAAAGAASSTVLLVLPMFHPEGEAILTERCARVRNVSGDPRAIAEAIVDADAAILRSPSYLSADAIAAGRRLRVVCATGAGYDCIDVAAATARGLPVLYSPGIGAPAVAEFVIGALIAGARRFPVLDRELRRPDYDWTRRFSDLRGVELRGRTLGIVGLGNIGREVARRARLGLEMEVLGLRSHWPVDVAPGDGVERVGTLDELLARSDFISINVPLTAATRGMIGPAEVAQMRPGAVLVNTARGGIVDETAVAAALRSGHLGFAAFDVFTGEPSPQQSPLFDAPNCLLTPHASGATDRAVRDLARSVAETLVAALDGRLDRSRVANPEVLGT